MATLQWTERFPAARPSVHARTLSLGVMAEGVQIGPVSGYPRRSRVTLPVLRLDPVLVAIVAVDPVKLAPPCCVA